MGYAARAGLHRTLTRDEVRALLRVSGEHARGYRDHMLFSFALGTGLREHELVALELVDITTRRGTPRRRVELRVFKGCNADYETAPQDVVLPRRLQHKLVRYFKWKRVRGESLDDDEPVFCSRQGRLTARRVRQIFTKWATLADLTRGLTFHHLRHTFIQLLWEQEKGDALVVKRAARHTSIQTTMRYAQPSVDQLAAAVHDMEC